MLKSIVGVIVAFSIVAFGCSAKTASSATNVSAATPEAAAAQTAPDSVKSIVLENEKQIWEAFKSQDASTLRALLADDVQIVTPNGRFNKTAFMSIVPELVIPSYTISNATVISPAADVAILTYDCRYTSREGRMTTHSSFQTTVWAKRDGKWIAVFNQETPH